MLKQYKNEFLCDGDKNNVLISQESKILSSQCWQVSFMLKLH